MKRMNVEKLKKKKKKKTEGNKKQDRLQSQKQSCETEKRLTFQIQNSKRNSVDLEDSASYIIHSCNSISTRRFFSFAWCPMVMDYTIGYSLFAASTIDGCIQLRLCCMSEEKRAPLVFNVTQFVETYVKRCFDQKKKPFLVKKKRTAKISTCNVAPAYNITKQEHSNKACAKTFDQWTNSVSRSSFEQIYILQCIVKKINNATREIEAQFVQCLPLESCFLTVSKFLGLRAPLVAFSPNSIQSFLQREKALKGHLIMSEYLFVTCFSNIVILWWISLIPMMKHKMYIRCLGGFFLPLYQSDIKCASSNDIITSVATSPLFSVNRNEYAANKTYSCVLYLGTSTGRLFGYNFEIMQDLEFQYHVRLNHIQMLLGSSLLEASIDLIKISPLSSSMSPSIWFAAISKGSNNFCIIQGEYIEITKSNQEEDTTTNSYNGSANQHSCHLHLAHEVHYTSSTISPLNAAFSPHCDPITGLDIITFHYLEDGEHAPRSTEVVVEGRDYHKSSYNFNNKDLLSFKLYSRGLCRAVMIDITGLMSIWDVNYDSSNNIIDLLLPTTTLPSIISSQSLSFQMNCTALVLRWYGQWNRAPASVSSLPNTLNYVSKSSALDIKIENTCSNTLSVNNNNNNTGTTNIKTPPPSGSANKFNHYVPPSLSSFAETLLPQIKGLVWSPSGAFLLILRDFLGGKAETVTADLLDLHSMSSSLPLLTCIIRKLNQDMLSNFVNICWKQKWTNEFNSHDVSKILSLIHMFEGKCRYPILFWDIHYALTLESKSELLDSSHIFSKNQLETLYNLDDNESMNPENTECGSNESDIDQFKYFVSCVSSYQNNNNAAPNSAITTNKSDPSPILTVFNINDLNKQSPSSYDNSAANIYSRFVSMVYPDLSTYLDPLYLQNVDPDLVTKNSDVSPSLFNGVVYFGLFLCFLFERILRITSLNKYNTVQDNKKSSQDGGGGCGNSTCNNAPRCCETDNNDNDDLGCKTVAPLYRILLVDEMDKNPILTNCIKTILLYYQQLYFLLKEYKTTEQYKVFKLYLTLILTQIVNIFTSLINIEPVEKHSAVSTSYKTMTLSYSIHSFYDVLIQFSKYSKLLPEGFEAFSLDNARLRKISESILELKHITLLCPYCGDDSICHFPYVHFKCKQNHLAPLCSLSITPLKAQTDISGCLTCGKYYSLETTRTTFLPLTFGGKCPLCNGIARKVIINQFS